MTDSGIAKNAAVAEPADRRGWLLHVGRCLLLVAIVLLVHRQHAESRLRAAAALTAPPLSVVRQVFVEAESLVAAADDSWQVVGSDGLVLGRVIQTSPVADDVIGFSGATNMLLGFDASGKLVGMTIVSSEDTRDHVQSVRDDRRFLTAMNGLTRDEMLAYQLDATSGATLTCVAIRQSIGRRLGSALDPGKFPEPMMVADVQLLFPEATAFSNQSRSMFDVSGSDGRLLGRILRTSPAADNEMGYQGPTDVLVGFSPAGTVIGFAVRKSFDNEPYVRYVREDFGFPTKLNDLNLAQLADFDLEEAGIEGVAGATMTSMGVARSIILAAGEELKPVPAVAPARSMLTVRDCGTIAVVAFAVLLAFTRLRGKKWVRITFQCVLIGYLGLVNGDMLSQALLVGWSRSGVPWSTATGLVVLSAAAFAVPILAGRNVYCSHLCPHGAVQQLVRNRLPWRVKLSKRWLRFLSFVPGLLLAWVVVVAAAGLGFSLVDIEPFDAWLFAVAGGATIAVAVVGLAASLVVPMAYCRFGCPTGALLQFVRKNRKSSAFTGRDRFAIACLVVAAVLSFL